MKVVMYPYRRDDAIVGLTGDFPELDWAVVSSTEELAREIPNATILVTSNRVCTPAFGEALRAHANALRWIFFGSSGVERGVAAGIPTGVRVTNSTGVKATMVAEHAMTLLLALLRQLPECQALQRAHLYRRQETNGKLKTLEDATVCVIGRGAIGREIVRKLKAFDAQPIAVSRTATDPGDLAAVYPRERITEGLTRADAVIICTAGDESSFRLIGEREIAAMKPTAYIVNVARGEIINEAALVAALAGGGSTGYFMHRNLFKQNLERLRAGQPLLNEINISNRP